jgi:hypothetical protein
MSIMTIVFNNTVPYIGVPKTVNPIGTRTGEL